MYIHLHMQSERHTRIGRHQLIDSQMDMCIYMYLYMEFSRGIESTCMYVYMSLNIAWYNTSPKLSIYAKCLNLMEELQLNINSKQIMINFNGVTSFSVAVAV